MSTTSYDPRYLELWRDGGTTGVELKLDKKGAVALRHRMYRLRQAMKAEAHPWYEAAERAAISIQFSSDDGKTWVPYASDKQLSGADPKTLLWKFCIQPPDARFDDALEAAGYKLTEPPPLE